MDTEIKNDTCSNYKNIFSISVSIFVVLLQCIYSIFGKYLVIYVGEGVVDLILNILLGGLLFLSVHFVVQWAYMKYWIATHKSIYLAGKWVHIHAKPNDHNYLRVGNVNIRQNFHDLSIEAENYSPKFDNGIVGVKDRSFTHWRHLVSEVDSQGSILGMYSASKKFSDRRSNKGIHQLMVVSHDSKSGFPNILGGDFADICPSISEGNTRWFRLTIGNKKPMKISSAVEFENDEQPSEWVKEITEIVANMDENAK